MRGSYEQMKWAATNQLSGRGIVVWICSFIEPDLFGNNVPFHNTTPIYLINLLWKLVFRIRVRLAVALFSNFFAENNKKSTLSSANFT